MNSDDEKDLQQILFLAGRILERQHVFSEGGSPALIADLPNPTNPPNVSDDGKTLFFPDLRADRDGTRADSGAANASQKEISVIFSEKEISEMPRYFRKIFRTEHKTAHVRRKKSGIYEIRIQIDGLRLSGSGRYLEDAKARFIEKLRAFDRGALVQKQKSGDFVAYMLKWLETVKKPYIKENTYKMYLQTFNAYILPTFKGRTVASLTQFELQEFINGFSSAGKNRTAQKIALLLSAVLDYAADDGIITRSPMKRVIVPRYEEEHGEPLTRKEESRLIYDFKAAPDVYKQAFVFMTYTGIRRSELASVCVFGGWVTVTSSKQRLGKKEKTRRLPVSPMLAQLLPLVDLEKIKALSPGVLTKRFKDLFPAHHLHDLRHTFITRAQECNIQRELVSLWAGHAADGSITSAVYTHLEQNEEHQREEMNKFLYDLG